MQDRPTPSPALMAIEVVEDRTATSRLDEGFLRLERLVVRNRYADGTLSEPYPCDVVRRRGSDAVVAALWARRGPRGVQVVLREAPRVPVYLRRTRTPALTDPRDYLTLLEVVAGLVEPEDGPGPVGHARRAAAEAREEVGLEIAAEAMASLGEGSFASPGTGDEKVLFQAGEVEEGAVAVLGADEVTGDGSVMEEWGRPQVLDLREALRACRDGRIPDLKTEVALQRLADHLGYLPQLDAWVHELPEEWSARHDSLGARPASGA
ncbi:MAG: NUDIX hydrolase [Planctomycetes bacterium]|nr:NUDIX hydrolase [Planctomycetota bacterium]MDA0947894.1 NUDIX hydrolase [Planctomycetota bacterium]